MRSMATETGGRDIRKLDILMILGVGASGAVPATLALFDLYPQPVEFLIWTALAGGLWVPLAVRRGVQRRILTMTLVGLVAGLFAGAIQSAFAHVMFENSPEVAAAYGGSATATVRMMFLGLSIVAGLVWGVVVGLAWAGAVAWRRRRARGNPVGQSATMGFVLLLLAGCSGTSGGPTDESPEATLLVDPDRPSATFGEVVTGPAVGPDLNATTAAAPRLVEGEWWRIRFESRLSSQPIEVVRVVANATDEGYIMGMPHEGWLKEAVAFHSPAFGDVYRDLSYNTHNVRFEPVRFPLEAGATWETQFALAPFRATVESADEFTATIAFTPTQDPQPTDPVTNALGLTGQGGMKLAFDARMHEIVRMESFVGAWEVVEHGYDFEGWVTVPRGEHTAIDYGTFGPASPDQPVLTRRIMVEGGFNRMTLMHLVAPLAPGSYHIRSVAPDGSEFLTEATTDLAIRFYEATNPDGEWVQEDFVAGAGATYSMGIAYHQYDIRLPDGQRRADHSHPVIR